jgi:hypothetical protein
MGNISQLWLRIRTDVAPTPPARVDVSAVSSPPAAGRDRASVTGHEVLRSALLSAAGLCLVVVLTGLLGAEIGANSWGREGVPLPVSADPIVDALFRAIDGGNASAVRAMLAGRPAGEANAADDVGRSPLVCAVRRAGPGSRDVIAALLVAGADVNRPDGLGCTPLAEAVRARQDDAAEVAAHLLAVGADPNGSSRLGYSPLHWATDARHGTRLVALLLAAGADPSVTDAEGRTPLDWAVEQDSVDAARLLGAVER